MLVPTGEMPIADRFAAIHDASTAARGGRRRRVRWRRSPPSPSALPTSLVTRLARTQAQTIDFATSNVRGSPIPMYVAGAQLLENYPVGPLAGVAFNLTLLSYHGSLDMGVNIDTAAVAEPDLLQRLPGDGLQRPARAELMQPRSARPVSWWRNRRVPGG